MPGLPCQGCRARAAVPVSNLIDLYLVQNRQDTTNKLRLTVFVFILPKLLCIFSFTCPYNVFKVGVVCLIIHKLS